MEDLAVSFLQSQANTLHCAAYARMYSTINRIITSCSFQAFDCSHKPQKDSLSFFHFYFHVLGALLKNGGSNQGKSFLNTLGKSDQVLIQQEEFVVFQEVLGSARKLALIVDAQSKWKGAAFDKQARIVLWLE